MFGLWPPEWNSLRNLPVVRWKHAMFMQLFWRSRLTFGSCHWSAAHVQEFRSSAESVQTTDEPRAEAWPPEWRSLSQLWRAHHRSWRRILSLSFPDLHLLFLGMTSARLLKELFRRRSPPELPGCPANAFGMFVPLSPLSTMMLQPFPATAALDGCDDAAGRNVQHGSLRLLIAI